MMRPRSPRGTSKSRLLSPTTSTFVEHPGNAERPHAAVNRPIASVHRPSGWSRSFVLASLRALHLDQRLRPGALRAKRALTPEAHTGNARRCEAGRGTSRRVDGAREPADNRGRPLGPEPGHFRRSEGRDRPIARGDNPAVRVPQRILDVPIQARVLLLDREHPWRQCVACGHRGAAPSDRRRPSGRDPDNSQRSVQRSRPERGRRPTGVATPTQ